ncbi:granzyme B-like [Parambassis ranga]|uniref:trypsin n=1 Tax=Parambassis ranga TaxID=210632 RepID=A0A6P7I4E8_9TELE|nr:granzyme B-like [Parambassis ranga]
MFTCCKLAILMLVLTLDGQVSAGRIVGGHEAVPHSRPYMMLIRRQNKTSQEKWCGGFLLNEDFVMTAAHCIAETYEVFLGLHDFSKERKTAQRIPVEQAFPHNDYKPDALIHDVMLLKLQSKAIFSDNVKPIALASQDDPVPKTCQIAGWGRTNRSDQYMSPKLMEANVTLTDNKKCELENAYCSEGDVGQGKGDSGGPLVCYGKAYGVVSSTFTPNSGGPYIHRFAKIPDYRKWITSTIRKALRSS